MNISNEKLNELENWINEYLEKQNTYEVHKKDKYEHSIRTANIAKQMYPNNKLLEVAMKFHDIGRFIQYDKIKSFDDKILSHYELGKQFIEEQEKNNNLSSSIDKADKVIQIIDKEDSINKYIKLIKIYINESISERCICHLKHIYKYYKIKE